MQDRYAGDVGDYVKLAILRALSPGRRLAVAWWLHPDGGPPGDGRHIPYLDRPDLWRRLDPEVYDALKRIVSSEVRRAAAIEGAGLLPGACWFCEPVPTLPPWHDREARRQAWFGRLREACAASDLVFVDPDNGLEPPSFRPGRLRAAKSVSFAELQGLALRGRTLIVYHHQTRTNGSHAEEIRYWAGRLAEAGFKSIDAMRAPSGSARAFFLLDADADMRRSASDLCERWAGALTWHPDAGRRRQ